jgi:hypothetical protein
MSFLQDLFCVINQIIRIMEKPIEIIINRRISNVNILVFFNPK